MESPMDQPDPALISVSLAFGARGRGHPTAVYGLTVDGKPIGFCPYAGTAAILVAEGRHSVSVTVERWTSEIVELDLVAGEHVELVCALKPLIRNRFFKVAEIKFVWFAMPLALVAFVNPGVIAFIERHLKFEFLAVVFVFCAGVLLSIPRAFSKKPGAMLSLTPRATTRDDDWPHEASARQVVFEEMVRLVSSGAHAFVGDLPDPPDQAGQTRYDTAFAPTITRSPVPLPVFVTLAAIDTCGVIIVTQRWFPIKPSPMFFVIALANGVLIGLLLAVQTGILILVLMWWRKWRATCRLRESEESFELPDREW